MAESKTDSGKLRVALNNTCLIMHTAISIFLKIYGYLQDYVQSCAHFRYARVVARFWYLIILAVVAIACGLTYVAYHLEGVPSFDDPIAVSINNYQL